MCEVGNCAKTDRTKEQTENNVFFFDDLKNVSNWRSVNWASIFRLFYVRDELCAAAFENSDRSCACIHCWFVVYTVMYQTV